jgi:riboflavin synthase|tara:strand:- start:1151 stop:1741 length:591 start_codon:yes stop_codon:yes gene_type:complete
MFTGIIETLGVVDSLSKTGKNINLVISSSISKYLKPDKSISHNGVCLTITECNKISHSVTLVDETLIKSNFLNIKIGSKINLERSLLINDRLDGHFVQGHIDDIAKCIGIVDNQKSWSYTFQASKPFSNLIVEKGSICVNGISLTCFDVLKNRFTVSIIPHTYNKTNFKYLKINDFVNIEYDILGKYINKIFKKNK